MGKVEDILIEWNYKDSIASICFHTTSANRGHLTAARVAIQEKLGRGLLWCACQHHVGEVVIGHVFKSLAIEAAKSPEFLLFGRMQTKWELIPQTNTRQFSRFVFI